MPSDAKKKAAARKKEQAKARHNNPAAEQNGDVATDDASSTTTEKSGVVTNGDVKHVAKDLESVSLEDDVGAQHRSCTGVLTSHARSRDVQMDSVTLRFYGAELLVDTRLELNCGRRYGLLGLNGSGKSTLLRALAARDLPIPDMIDIFLLSREAGATTKSALEAVMDVDAEVKRLESEAEQLAHISGDDDDAHDKLMDVYARLDELGSDQAEANAASILHGLGFTAAMQNKQCKDFSGGWRMRIALARALYLKPCLLILDEPTNHLDLDACVWLEQELAKYTRILVVVSHSQDFLNNVCTNIVHLHQKKLDYYGGNYDTFVKTRIEHLENQMKRYNWEQNQIANMKQYIARFGHGSAKLARQAQSKEKTLAKMQAEGLTEKVTNENVKDFCFFDPGEIPPPVIMVRGVSFRYNDKTEYIYKDLEFGIDLDTRIALVGPNGCGKSTLLNLISGEVMPTDGLIRRHSHVKISRYHQHLAEQLDLSISALDYLDKEFPMIKEREDLRSILGRFGISGRQQTCPMEQLSDGQRCRVSFSHLANQRPHILLLDEPTNHLDIETIDALADAINGFEGGMVLVSHDFRLIKQVCEVIWICEKQNVRPWDKDIFAYKEYLRRQVARAAKRAVASSKKV